MKARNVPEGPHRVPFSLCLLSGEGEEEEGEEEGEGAAAERHPAGRVDRGAAVEHRERKLRAECKAAGYGAEHAPEYRDPERLRGDHRNGE